MKVIALVGLGPRGAGVLERLVSNAVELEVGPIEIHLVDPYPPGGGRVWRADQSPLLRLNSTAEDVTAFVDESVQMSGPVVTGPTLFEWARTLPPGDLGDPGLEREATGLSRLDFASRRLASAYFSWAHEQVVRRAPDDVDLVSHRQRAVDLHDAPGGGQRLTLEDGTLLEVDAVVLLSSHVDVSPAEPFATLAQFAHDQALVYLPPAYGGDVDLDLLGAGEDVIVRGLGLGFADLMVLLTEGRGGRFVDSVGGLSYLPSGREPVLHVGSRRGVPYHCKPMYHLQAPKPVATRFLTPAAVRELMSVGGTSEFRRDVWPLVAKEISWGYYVELGQGHDHRLAVEWEQFERDYAALTWGTTAYTDYLGAVVLDPGDLFDLAALDQPLQSCPAGDAAALSDRLRRYVRDDIQRRLDVEHSADLGAFHAFLAVLPVLSPLLTSGRLSARSLTEEFYGWFMGLFNFYASGPPPDRLEQLLALEKAGVVRFLGASLTVEPDHLVGDFVARSSSLTDPFHARQLIDATLPALALSRVTDPLLRSLFRRGEASSLVLHEEDGGTIDTGQLRVDARHRMVDRDGVSAERRFSLGMHTTVRSAAFARPGSNGPVHRHNDQVARELLQLPSLSYPAAASLSGQAR